MSIRRGSIAFVLAVLFVAGCGGDESGEGASIGTSASPSTAGTTTGVSKPARPARTGKPKIKLRKVTEADSPVHVTYRPGASAREIVIVEKAGRILIFEGGKASTLLDIRERVGSDGSEQGLLSVAFHPKYADNGRLYVNYTDMDGDTRIVEFEAKGDKADVDSARELLKIDQPYSNHNGGLSAFGPDGMLYIGTGDGGSGGDPEGRAQDTSDLLGKLLRIDVDGGKPYAVPGDNPYTEADGRREIYAIGLRNPWRFSFDRESNLLTIGDVGQNQWEELNATPLADVRGANFGWDAFEGSHRFEQSKLSPGKRVDPVHEYSHESGGCSVTGGFVYRGRAIPNLVGYYLYADFCTSWIKAFEMRGGTATAHLEFEGTDGIATFGEDAAGEIYVTSLSGGVFKVVAG